MAQYRTITSFLNYTPSATSEDTNFLASNLELYGHPFRPWKALVATGIVDVTLDFGVGNTLSALAADPGLFLYPLNVSSIRIQGNDSLSWGSPPWDQAVTVNKARWTSGPDLGRYQGFWRLADLDPTAFAYRYLNIRIPSQTPVDGLPYRIGVAVVGHAPELVTNPRFSIGRAMDDPALRVEFLDGGREILEMGERALELRLPRVLASDAALNDQLDLDALGISQPFVIWDGALGGSQDAWLVRRADRASYEQGYTTFHEGELALREVT